MGGVGGDFEEPQTQVKLAASRGRYTEVAFSALILSDFIIVVFLFFFSIFIFISHRGRKRSFLWLSLT